MADEYFSQNTVNFGKHFLQAVQQNSNNPMYLAIGSGDATWDDGTVPEPDLNTTQLLSESHRILINQDDTGYQFVDPDDYEILSAIPTTCLRVTGLIGNGAFTGTIREWGLFGVNASIAPNTGTLLSYGNHPKIVIPMNASIMKHVYIKI
jgi:hypothetical protein